MKKNETKAGRNKPPEVRTREQMEDRIFNKMLLWLAAAAVVEVVMVLINRYYVHARISELEFKLGLRTALVVVAVVGVVLFLLFLAQAVRARKNGREGTLSMVLACGFLVLGAGAFLMRTYEVTIAPLVLAGVPALGVLALVFYLYQKEFFACAVVAGLCLAGLWLFRASAGSVLYCVYLVVVLVIAAAGVALSLSLKKRDGVMKLFGKDCALVEPGAAYLPYYLTAALTAFLLLAPLALGAAVAYYAMWLVAAWLFILAVYFTSRMM